MQILKLAFRRLNKTLQNLGLRLVRDPLRIRRIARIAPYEESARHLLSPTLLETVTVDYKRPNNSLFLLSRRFDNVDKWHQYFDVYERELSRFRHAPIRLLEIGVFRGGSLHMWKEWFHPDSTIVGIDIEPASKTVEEREKGILVRIGDQTDADFLSAVSDELGPFDIIIDDGGHMTSQMIASFNHLFKPALKEAGIYLVEDVHTNYWQPYIDTRKTFLELAAGMIDLMHSPYIGKRSTDSFRMAVSEPDLAPILMPYLAAHTARLTFWDSIVVIEKGNRSRPLAEPVSPIDS